MKVNLPNEFIVVEGRSDTARLQQIYGLHIKTIETNGSAIDEKVLDQIRKAQESDGVIVLTDPDFPGQRIRHLISQALPSVKHAYIKKQEAIGKKSFQNVGVEYASADSIIQAINSVMTINQESSQASIPIYQLMELGLIAGPQAKDKRLFLADQLHIGYVNGKQLQKRLAMYQISIQDIRKVLENYDGI